MKVVVSLRDGSTSLPKDCGLTLQRGERKVVDMSDKIKLLKEHRLIRVEEYVEPEKPTADSSSKKTTGSKSDSGSAGKNKSGRG